MFVAFYIVFCKEILVPKFTLEDLLLSPQKYKKGGERRGKGKEERRKRKEKVPLVVFCVCQFSEIVTVDFYWTFGKYTSDREC